MAVTRSTGVFLGTDESTGVTIANNVESLGSEVDVLGDNASGGEVHVYLKFTSTVTAGNLLVRINHRRITGQAYLKRSYDVPVPPINGTDRVDVGRFSASRYMSGDVKNDATGASATSVTLGYELFKVS